jgi:WhiB family transcriptional regulator, redox-sensing transcriptional regulator
MNNWEDKALCAGNPGLWFGPDGEHPAARAIRETQAKTVCSVCPVTAECLQSAITAAPEHGIWAGRTPRQIRDTAAQTGRPRTCATCAAVFLLPDPMHPTPYCSTVCREHGRRRQQLAYSRRAPLRRTA